MSDSKNPDTEQAAKQDPNAEKSSVDAKVLPLRVWPAILLLLIIWAMRLGPSFVEEPSMGVMLMMFMGPAAIALLVLLWWILLSRARLKERLIGTVGVLAIAIVTIMLSDQSIKGFGSIIFAIPWGATAFAVAAIIARSWYPARTYLALLAALVGFGYWDLVRTDEILGDFEQVRSWRWVPSAEDRLLEKLATQSNILDENSKTVAAEPLATPEWPAFRGASRRGEQPGVVLEGDWDANPPKELWRIPVGPGFSSFAVAGNRLFTQEQRGEHEVVVCYNANNGKELWVYQDDSRFWETVGGAGPRSTPTLAGQALYTMGANGLVNRLDPIKGEKIWQADVRKDADRAPPTWGFSSSPLVADGLVIVHAGGAGDKGLLAYDAETGDLRWSAPAGNHSYSSAQMATLDGKKTVIIITNDGISFVDPADGRLLGHHENTLPGYRVIQPLILDRTTVLLGSPMDATKPGTERLNLKWDGDQFEIESVWYSTKMRPYFNDFVAHEGYLYGFDHKIFACIDLKDGERKWKKGRYGNGQVILLPDSGHLLISTEKGDVVLLRINPEKMDEVGRIQVLDGRTWNHPVVVGNRLYIRNGEEAVCMELKTKQTSSPEPTAQ